MKMISVVTMSLLIFVSCFTTSFASEPKADAEWTFIYYLAADNDQESYAEVTIDKLLTSTAHVLNHPQIIVLRDRQSIYGTEVFEVAGGMPVPLENYEEQNTADGNILQDYAQYALSQAKNKHVAFVMKSEGLSWRGIGRDNTHDEEINDQLMTNGDLAQALRAAQDTTGKNIDLVVLEGSIMAFVEVVYELRNAAPVLLASQSKIQPDGLPWDLVIEDLGNTPGMSNKELGINITDNYSKDYGEKGNSGSTGLETSTNFAAMTVFDLSYAADVLGAHRIWAEATWNRMDEIYNILPHARDLAEVGGLGEITDFDYNTDLKTFMQEGLRLIEEAGLSFPEINEAVSKYITAQDNLVVYEQSPADGDKLKATTGMSIWYPPTWNKYETRDESDDVFGSTMYYEDPAIGLDWISDSNWLTYLFAYFDRANAKLAGKGTEGDEPPKKGVFEKINVISEE
jgi:hypothetical protein